MDKITMVHGSGGEATAELIREVFAQEYGNEFLDQMNDAAVLPGGGDLALTTDSFVAWPLFFPGGDIGRLAVAGTVNDLLTSGAVPYYLTAAFILEEGLLVEDLKRIVRSMAETAGEAGVKIVAGDTKVVEGKGGLFINTTGVGFVPYEMEISPKKIREGDAVLVTGTLGEHHAAMLTGRMKIENNIQSDVAPLNGIVRSLINEGVTVHALRDVTRGGLATVLSELSEQSGKTILLKEELLPVLPEVRDFCGLLGLDPLYMGNEGKMVCIVPMEEKEKALSIIRGAKYGEGAVLIGEISAKEKEEPGLLLQTSIGGLRRLFPLQGEGLPRIC